MPHDFINKNFERFRENLLYYSRKFDVSYEVREEMVNDSILAAIDNFDHDRGSFESYCRVILKNKFLNFNSDKKNLSVLISLDDYEEILPAHDSSIESNENVKSTLMFFQKLKVELKPDELEVFDAVFETCDQLNKINITKVSESIGISSDVAWNIFRKIQRKANKLYKKLKAKNVELLFTIEQPSETSDHEHLKFQKDIPDKASHARLKFQKDIPDTTKYLEHFISKLTPIQIDKINSIYNE